MNNEIDQASLEGEAAKEVNISLREMLDKYLRYWPAFIIAIFLSLGIAHLYLRYTKPVYQITSTLLIKDEKSASADDILSQLDLAGSSKVIENEIEILQSKTLMAEVVKRLSLNVSLSKEGRMVNSDLYTNPPLRVAVVSINPEFYGRTLELSILNSREYSLNDLDSGRVIKGLLNQLQRNEIGTFKIETTAFFKNPGSGYSLVFYNPAEVISQSLSNLSITVANKQSTVLRLSFNTTDQTRGRDILNMLVQVYNEVSLSEKNTTTRRTISFIDERLALISGELTDVEKDVEGFKSSQGLTDISSEASSFLEKVSANDASLNEVNLQLGTVRDIKRYISSDNPQEKLPGTMGITDPVLLSQISQLNELQLKKINLLATTKPNNPVFESVNQQIEAIRAGIRSSITNIEASLENTRNRLGSFNSKYEGSIKKIPGQERQFISIKRQQSIKENLYLYLLQKKEEAALSYASAIADSRVVDPASSLGRPISPDRQKTYLAALFIGFFIPLAFVYGKELLNTKVLSSADLVKLTSVPILGELMLKRDDELIVVQAGSRKAIAEQFRSIRTNLQYIQGKRSGQKGFVTLFTSSMSGEGKSFVGSNIAASLALSGKKTVLLELDLRKPKITAYLNLKQSAGLSNYLVGRATEAEIIQPSDFSPNLMIIGSGPVPANPSELLIGREIELLFDYLRANFDEIIVDTPPIGLITDAQILARLADATIYIVRYGYTQKQQVAHLEQLYKSKKFPRINIIFNGVKNGGRYGYGYGDSYGYYSDNVKRKPSKKLPDLLKGLLKRG